MILSYHPCYVGDRNLLCAGRPPDANDASAMAEATAVILPQGCPEALYRLARQQCPQLFPHYDVRFGFPGKRGQARLFGRMDIPHPVTLSFAGVDDFFHRHPRWRQSPPLDLPLVFKFDWGGGGDTVFRVAEIETLVALLDRAAQTEKSGAAGFVLQAFVPGDHRTLRVAVIGEHREAYWRIQTDPTRFHASVCAGAVIERSAFPEQMAAGIRAVDDFCRRTAVNLAGFDLLFPENRAEPLFLEINWFFGRRGLGGSEPFYTLLTAEIDRWLGRIGVFRKRGAA